MELPRGRKIIDISQLKYLLRKGSYIINILIFRWYTVSDNFK